MSTSYHWTRYVTYQCKVRSEEQMFDFKGSTNKYLTLRDAQLYIKKSHVLDSQLIANHYFAQYIPILQFEIFLILEIVLIFNLQLREAPPKLSPGSKGHCPNSDCPPPPLPSSGHSGALYFRTEMSNFVKSLCLWL